MRPGGPAGGLGCVAQDGRPVARLVGVMGHPCRLSGRLAARLENCQDAGMQGPPLPRIGRLEDGLPRQLVPEGVRAPIRLQQAAPGDLLRRWHGHDADRTPLDRRAETAAASNSRGPPPRASPRARTASLTVGGMRAGALATTSVT